MSPMTDDPNFTYPAEALCVAHARGKHEAAREILAVLRERLPDAAKVGKIAAVLDDLVGPFDAEPLAASSSPAWEPIRELIAKWRTVARKYRMDAEDGFHRSQNYSSANTLDRCVLELEALLPPAPKEHP